MADGRWPTLLKAVIAGPNLWRNKLHEGTVKAIVFGRPDE